jgi:hypothetical protein
MSQVTFFRIPTYAKRSPARVAVRAADRQGGEVSSTNPAAETWRPQLGAQSGEAGTRNLFIFSSCCAG